MNGGQDDDFQDLYTPYSHLNAQNFPKVFSMDDFNQLSLDSADDCKNQKKSKKKKN